MTDNNKKIALLLISIGTLFWGTVYISTKIVLGYISSTSLLFFRYSIAAISLFALMKIKERNVKLQRKFIPRIILSSILGINLCFYFQTIALKSISVSTAGLMNGTIPILTLLAEIIFFGKKATKKIVVSFLLSSLGIYLAVAQPSLPSNQSVHFMGYVFMILGIICWIVYTFVTEPLSTEYSSLSILTYQSAFASILMLPFMMKDIVITNYITLFISEKMLLVNLIYMGVFCTALTYYGYVYSISVLGPSTTSIFTNFIPIVSMIGGYFVFGESITLKKSIGAVLVLLSIALVNYNSKYKLDEAIKSYYSKYKDLFHKKTLINK